MKTFRFRLKGLLQLKDAEASKHQRLLAELNFQRRMLEARRSSLQQQMLSLPSTPSASSSQSVQWQARADYLQWLGQSVVELDRQLMDVSRQHQECLKRLESVLQSKKSLENYRARQLSRYTHQRRKRQTQILDELGSRMGASSREQQPWAA